MNYRVRNGAPLIATTLAAPSRQNLIKPRAEGRANFREGRTWTRFQTWQLIPGTTKQHLTLQLILLLQSANVSTNVKCWVWTKTSDEIRVIKCTSRNLVNLRMADFLNVDVNIHNLVMFVRLPLATEYSAYRILWLSPNYTFVCMLHQFPTWKERVRDYLRPHLQYNYIVNQV